VIAHPRYLKIRLFGFSGNRPLPLPGIFWSGLPPCIWTTLPFYIGREAHNENSPTWIIPQSFANTSMKNTVRLLSLLVPLVG